MTALGLARHLGVPQPAEQWKHQLYRLDQLASTRPATLPDDGVATYDGYRHRLLEQYIERQVWSDEPIAPYR